MGVDLSNFIFDTDGLKDTTQALLSGLNKKNRSSYSEEQTDQEQVKIILSFKIYIHDPSKRIIQM